MRLKKFIVTLFLALALITPAKNSQALFGVGDIVFDPAVFAETILQFLKDSAALAEDYAQTASAELSNVNEEIALLGQIKQIANELEQIMNQVEQIKNQGTQIANQVEQITRFDEMLEDWAMQLAKLDPGDIEGFLTAIAEDLENLQNTVDNSRGIMSEWENPDAKFDAVFDSMSSDLPLVDDALVNKRNEWNKEMLDSSFDSDETLEMLDSTRDLDEGADALARVNEAEGDVGVLQAQAGLLAIEIRQNAQLKYLLASLNHKIGMESAFEASERDQAVKITNTLMEGYDDVTEFNITPYTPPGL